ncbi:MAG: hypothetical protein ACREFO_20665 [Acetobacteraceae bacterium]
MAQAAPFGSFETWARMVRDAVVWGGLPDPVASVEAVRSSDQTLAHLAALTEAWRGAIGLSNPMICAAVFNLAERQDPENREGKRLHHELHEALQAVAADRGRLSAQRLGNYLGRMRGRRLNGLRFEVAPQSRGVGRWQLLDRTQRQ